MPADQATERCRRPRTSREADSSIWPRLLRVAMRLREWSEP